MAEEVKKKKSASKVTASLFKVILGLVLIVLGIWAIFGWWPSLVILFKGCIGVLLALAGLIAIAIAKE